MRKVHVFIIRFLIVACVGWSFMAITAERSNSLSETPQPANESEQAEKRNSTSETQQPVSEPERIEEVKASGENWDVIMTSIENTGKQKWKETAAFESYKEIRDKTLAFWKITVDLKYKEGPLKFKTSWIDVIYKTHTGEHHENNIVGFISTWSLAEDEAIFGAFEITSPTKENASQSLSYLFLAPKDTEEITYMAVKFREYPEVQIPLQRLKSD